MRPTASLLRRLKVALHRRQRPARYALLEDLLATQALSPEAVLDKQRQDLRAMIDFARQHTIYYADRYAGLPAEPPLDALPILTKQEVVDHLSELLARGHDPATTPLGHTGGSTGKPLAFYYNEAKHELMRAGMMRSYMMSGWRPGDKIINFWGARQDTVSGGVFGGARWDEWIAAEQTIAAHTMSEDRLTQWATTIQRERPVLLQGYASILACLARHVIDRRLLMPDSLIGVYSTAEVLDEAQRQLIGQAFGCRVFNQYGSREIPNIACECRHGRMHVFTDMVQLESLDGQLLITSLTNRLMPMIRYRNGDSGELLDERCDCGSPFPLMAMGVCRQNDLIVAPDGRRIHPAFFNRLLYGQTQITQYQFVQETPTRISLRLVCPQPPATALTDALREAIRRELGAGVELAIEHVDEIERSLSGKHRFVICRYPPG